MKTQKYAVNQYLIESILAKVRENEIAIPEIQRPFVWDGSQVRDLLDSLYQGYPVGYLIAWRNPTVKLKDGTTAAGKMILIDGQQRVTALTAAIIGQQVINKDYQKTRIMIAFNPMTEQFEVSNPAISKNTAWITDIAPIVSGTIRLTKAVNTYTQANPTANEEQVEQALANLTDIAKKQIGLIELAHDLDIEMVTEIFIRINSKGTVLSQADFVMSKIAADQRYGGQELRKCIDYFCHMAIAPEFHDQIKESDPSFAQSTYFQKMAWLRNEHDTLYNPSYNDMLRVAFTKEFGRGKLADLVSLLSGRNFETKTFEESIVETSFAKLSTGILDFINESNFKRFIMIIKSAGFIDTRMIKAQSPLNFAYIVSLLLKTKGVKPEKIESLVRRWFVMSLLTGRYSGAGETRVDQDIRQFADEDCADVLANNEKIELSNTFWEISLVQKLETSGMSSPYFWVFVAAQIRANDKGLLSKDITIRDLVSHLGDIHHIFPRDLLKKAGKSQTQYNQIANYVYMQEEINIKIGNKTPSTYFSEVLKQCNGEPMHYGGIADMETLHSNFANNCVPETVFKMDVKDYDAFLKARRTLMAAKIRAYYSEL
ncbi:MAG: DUF262 domain-containing protein [Magnetococcus sp. YQC-5]